MSKIYDFTEYRLNKMSPWEKMMELDRQAKKAVVELNGLNVGLVNAKAGMPKPKPVSVGKALLVGIAVVTAVTYLATRK